MKENEQEQEPLTPVEHAKGKWPEDGFSSPLRACDDCQLSLLEFIPNAPVDYVDINDHFKYGSIGSEPANGIPYWIGSSADMFPRSYLHGQWL